jgi:hypothetical protein
MVERFRARSKVIAGLDPAIHDEVRRMLTVSMDCRVKPGNDEGVIRRTSQ